MVTVKALVASLLLSISCLPLVASADSTRLVGADIAINVLHRYAVAFTLHYLCGRNPMAATTFSQIPPHELSPVWAAQYSPSLMELSGLVNADGDNLQLACSPSGVFSDQYPEVELSDNLLNGLRLMDRQGNARLAFENGTWFRLTGHEPDFERYVEQLIARLTVTFSTETRLSTLN